ncbi:MAG: hypothetical protein IJZ08_03815 [Clostridia bacterium]|nr:hypothetical protein [Clostridia bacterium]
MVENGYPFVKRNCQTLFLDATGARKSFAKRTPVRGTPSHTLPPFEKGGRKLLGIGKLNSSFALKFFEGRGELFAKSSPHRVPLHPPTVYHLAAKIARGRWDFLPSFLENARFRLTGCKKCGIIILLYTCGKRRRKDLFANIA